MVGVGRQPARQVVGQRLRSGVVGQGSKRDAEALWVDQAGRSQIATHRVEVLASLVQASIQPPTILDLHSSTARRPASSGSGRPLLR